MVGQRINRIIGQLRGIQRMVETKRDCHEVLQQISAVKKAIDGLSKELVVKDMCRYMVKDESARIRKVIDRVMSA